eukprot:CAMPEP_0168513196 /NCGR_PEP_ID=MMETSP0405-20121227/3293_1 /TAXON_ID=498012 /ORGANISM="Trichosphaerium sp, Strain Am-I-7 wt" /LENGTH=207 /DNA_ID=CAMNT_0008531931 /DNA_START=142 /DNA_END=761 /DNA_ORIENTATION=-
MNRGSREPSILPKTVLTLSTWASVCVTGYLTFDSGCFSIRDVVLIQCASTVALRTTIAIWVLFKRAVTAVTWEESISVSFFINFNLGLIAYMGSQGPAFGLVDVGFLAMYLFGSYLNTYSEFQRMIWKFDPKNKGKLYVEGLFAYSRHINYFGDIVLYTGYALLSRNWVSLVVPLIMYLGFKFMHIPDLEKYLTKYGDDFEEYKKNV